jgi:S1-C subfamily serine protease
MLQKILRASFVLVLLEVGVVHASDRLDSALLKSVLRIETAPSANGEPNIGSGFLVTATEDAAGRVFLVTNKHMIGDWNYADGNIETFQSWINVFFYRANDPSGQTYRPTRVDLLNGTTLDATRVHLHPTPKIDLVAIDVTDKVRDQVQHIEFTAYMPSYLVQFGNIQVQLTYIADEVIALGYPLGIRSLKNSYPLAKIGYLASTPGEEVSIPVRLQNRARAWVNISIDGKFLVVDGLIVPGNSGGPVVLAGGIRVRHDPVTNQFQVSSQSIKNYVAGVVSYGLGGGLTLVSSDYLLDLLQSLAPPASN